MATGREQIIDYLRSHLFGPREGRDESLIESPSSYYTTGVLFPVSKGDAPSESSDIVDEKGGADDGDDPVPRNAVTQPSSIGITFVTTAESVECTVTFGTYERSGKTWRRTPHEVTVTVSPSNPHCDVLAGRARIVSKWRRPGADGTRAVTVALLNSFPGSDSKGKPGDEGCLFQAHFTCVVPTGVLHAQPTPIRELTSEEEDELAFQYRNHQTFAVGHGCAAHWERSTAGTVTWASAECLPIHEVASTSPTTSRDTYLDLRWLACLEADKVDGILELVDEYETAIERMIADNPALHAGEIEASARLVARMRQSAARMREGVELLKQDEVLLRAFRLANEAMLLQMWRTRSNFRLNGQTRSPEAPVDETPSIYDLPFGEYYWRPFQLAFMLMNVAPLSRDDNEYRDIVDLIWFPTGGGKTEAYLFVTAFEVMRRRLQMGERGGGTTVISRYTMRLLTAQQFERASTLACAMEHLRRQHATYLGETSIDIGLWIGQDNTPNTFARAKEAVDEIEPSWTPPNPFAIQRCPWCHTRLIPGTDEPITNIGFKATNSSFVVACPNRNCDFSSSIPVQVVDEALYLKPPTILLAVVDKFAALPRETRIRNFLGGNGTEPPSLIIQDELHLLGSSLGTVFGVYEAAIDTVLGQLGGGIRPHIIASTATIRDASAQVRNLFGRDCRVFPSPGLSADFNFFSALDPSVPGRIYVGVAAPSHTPATSIIRTVALLSQSIEEVDLNASENDAYFTQVVYHNSLRELGKVVTYAADDIPDWIGVVTSQDAAQRRLGDDNIEELTGNVKHWALPRLLERLQRPSTDPECIALLACTNMLSVGVDVQRLGMMTVNGQPKATSEYIQATSRVGRQARTHPGLVVTHYATSKPRDISHYETFHTYHQSLYRFVEPTSVTPWALPARDRCLPAVVVAVIRLVEGLRHNDQADEFDPSRSSTADAIEALINRMKATLDVDCADAAQHVRDILEHWTDMIEEYGARLVFVDEGKNVQPLLTTFTKRTTGAWPALTSFRNVDKGCAVEVKGWY